MGANSMAAGLTENEFKIIQKYRPAPVPRRHGNFRNLTGLNDKTITEYDMFNTLYFEFFPDEKLFADERGKNGLHRHSNSMSINSSKPPKPTKLTTMLREREQNLIKTKLKQNSH